MVPSPLPMMMELSSDEISAASSNSSNNSSSDGGGGGSGSNSGMIAATARRPSSTSLMGMMEQESVVVDDDDVDVGIDVGIDADVGIDLTAGGSSDVNNNGQVKIVGDGILGHSTCKNVYIRSADHAWIPARIITADDNSDNDNSDNDNNSDNRHGRSGRTHHNTAAAAAAAPPSSRPSQTIAVSVPIYEDERAISTDGGKSALRFEQRTISLGDYDSALPLQNVDPDGRLVEVENMVELPFLHEPAILYNLKARHMRGKPYTRTGDIIVAVNPYQWMAHLYTTEVRSRYATALIRGGGGSASHNNNKRSVGGIDDPITTLEPHVYETSSLAFRGMVLEGRNQSILVSGESGAGKTETIKILLSHLATMQEEKSRSLSYSTDKREHSRNDAEPSQEKQPPPPPPPTPPPSPIVQRILDSNPILEAFGNAKTAKNDNSSRFGKYLQLQFDVDDPALAAYYGKGMPSCILAGSKCEVYLLEKSRVVAHSEGERTYHIFYQLLAAPENEKIAIWEGLRGTDHDSFLYLGHTDSIVNFAVEGRSDAERYQRTKDALESVGITGDLFRSLMRAICIVLQLGNLKFGPKDGDDDKSDIVSVQELQQLSELMGAKPEAIRTSLTQRTVRARNEDFKIPLKADAAKESCDALAKDIYSKTFSWLVRSINDATAAESNYSGEDRRNKSTEGFGVIGLLDIFGFESFTVNRFEQLCINYANEKLQQKFTQDVFRSVQAEYEAEGIKIENIVYKDNINVLNLVEGRLGLIALLNEECVRPKGSDSNFVSNMTSMNKGSGVLFTQRSFRGIKFGVKHYAGELVYDATSFVTKNQDSIPTELLACARRSTNPVIASELRRADKENISKNSPLRSIGLREKKGSQNQTQRSLGPASKWKVHGSTVAAIAAATIAAAQAPTLKRKGSRVVMSETVWSKFKGQLNALMTSLAETKTRYIRCIKPNNLKKPRLMAHSSTVEQLRCAGIVAAVTVSRSAFPNRLEHGLVLDRFKILHGYHGEALNFDHRDHQDATRRDVDALLTHALKSMKVPKSEESTDGQARRNFVVGKTRAYFGKGALEYLESERIRRLSHCATVIKSLYRGYQQRIRFIEMQSVAAKNRAVLRRFLADMIKPFVFDGESEIPVVLQVYAAKLMKGLER